MSTTGVITLEEWRAQSKPSARKSSRASAKPASPLEAWEQKQVVRWMSSRGIELFSVPNEGRRSPGLANHMKALGMRHGVPDLIVITPPPAHPEMRLAIEMKRTDGSTADLTKHQIATHEAMARNGWTVWVCFGHEQTITRLKEVGYGP